jgi:hypothetical protein
MKHMQQAPKGQTFTAGDLVGMLDGLPFGTEVKIGVRFNGRPYRVEWEDGPQGAPPDPTTDPKGFDAWHAANRPEAVPASKGIEPALVPFDQCATPAPRGDDGTDAYPLDGAPTGLPEGERRGEYVVQGGRWRHVSKASPERPWAPRKLGDRPQA